MPVYITRETGTRYVVLMRGTLSLPKLVPFPSGYLEPNVFRLGVGLKGEIKVPARHLRNVMIGAGQGAGKSNVLDLLSYQMGSSDGSYIWLTRKVIHSTRMCGMGLV
jgi:hypothetical protein